MSEYITAPQSALVRLPDNVSFEQAARFGYLGTAYAAIRKSGAGPGHSLLVNGIGGALGLCVALVGLATGATKILGTGRNQTLLDRVKALAPEHPEWKTKPPFKAVLDGDLKALAASGQKGLGELVTATHTGMTTDEFTKIVADWIVTAQHPRFKRPYTDLVFQPMVELLTYLRANGFKTYIVSGGTIEFMRPWTERIYGIPPEQVVGTSFVTTFKLGNDGRPMLVRQPKIDFVDDGPGKPVNIQKVIGRRPVLAFGNSDGDQQMLEWTAAGEGARFMGLVHHTDAVREWAYDRQSHIGRLDKALDEAAARGWTVVDMKADWKKIFSFE